MARLPKIRVNTLVPFPSLVQGSGPVTIGKVKGIWTVGFSVTGLTNSLPSNANFPTDYVMVWDNIAKAFFSISLSQLVAPTQASATASPYVVQATDDVVLCNLAGALAITLPAANTRGGMPLTIKDVSGAAAAHNITANRAGADLIDGAATAVISTNYGALRLLPIATGWSII